jgi:hypothetical protein
MTTQIVRDTTGVITTGKFCLFNGSRSKMFCETGDNYRYYKLVRMETVDINTFINSLRLSVDGVSIPLIIRTDFDDYTDQPYVSIFEDYVELRNQPLGFKICSTYAFQLVEQPM